MLQLTASSFEPNGRLKGPLQRGGRLLVRFHAPWCPHCQAMAPAWQDLQRALPPDTALADVDCEAHTIPFISAYPTLLLYDNTGTPHRVDPALPYLARAATPQGTDVLVAFLYAPWCGHCHAAMPEVAAFERQLRPGQARVVRVDCEASPDIAAKRNVRAFPTVQIIANGRHTEWVGRFTRQQLSAFYQRSLPLLLQPQASG